MPRPTLRRTVSTPLVRPRASSNPYPPTSPMTTRSMVAAMAASSANATAGPSSLSSNGGASTSTNASTGVAATGPTTRSRRVNSVSSAISDSRRVLADITWCYDGQLASDAPIIGPAPPPVVVQAEGRGAAPPIGDIPELDDNMEHMTSLTPVPEPSIVEEDEEQPHDEQAEMLMPMRVGTPEPSDYVDPFALLTLVDSQPSSTNSSPGMSLNRRRARRPTVSRSLSEGVAMTLGHDLPMDITVSIRSRREASYSSISTCSDFEDVVPSPTYT